jgi:DNA-binding transcriptional regulator YdaS (Cro superfamily)
VANVYTRALKRAAEIAGGDDALASRLKVKPASLASWLNGSVTPPAEVFLEAVDVISAHELSSLRPAKD